MEEQYKQITNIINELASQNPFITKEQVSKAKSMYNGDTRSIDVIREELEAYSNQILAQGLKTKEGKNLSDMNQSKEVDSIFSKPHGINIPEIEKPEPTPVEPQQEQPEEIYEPLRAELPNEEQKKQLQSMIDDALGGSANDLDNNALYEQNASLYNNQEKVLVKSQQESVSSSANDGGYGNVAAILSLTIIFSIVTIIMAFFTIISK